MNTVMPLWKAAVLILGMPPGSFGSGLLFASFRSELSGLKLNPRFPSRVAKNDNADFKKSYFIRIFKEKSK